MSENEIDRLAAALLALRDRRDVAKAAVADIERELEVAEGALAMAMDRAAVADHVHAGWSLVRSIRESWRVLPSYREQAIQVLKTHAREIVRESVNSATLTAYVRRRRRELAAMPWWNGLLPYLGVRERDCILVRAARSLQPLRR